MDLERLAEMLRDGIARFDELVAAKAEELARPRITELEQQLADLQERQRRVLDRRGQQTTTQVGLMRDALAKVALAAVTLNAETRAPNDIYHLLRADLTPVCGATSDPDLVPREHIVQAVTVPLGSRCNRVGCDLPWREVSYRKA